MNLGRRLHDSNIYPLAPASLQELTERVMISYITRILTLEGYLESTTKTNKMQNNHLKPSELTVAPLPQFYATTTLVMIPQSYISSSPV